MISRALCGSFAPTKRWIALEMWAASTWSPVLKRMLWYDVREIPEH
jgi:hypothetical protein